MVFLLNMNATDKLEMQVSEENDGSAVAILPSGIENPQADTENDADDGDDEESGSDVVDSISIDDPEREAIREAKRANSW